MDGNRIYYGVLNRPKKIQWNLDSCPGPTLLTEGVSLSTPNPQVMRYIISLCMSPPIRVYASRIVLYNIVTQRTILEQCSVSVSYTHLDVYKRQQ